MMHSALSNTKFSNKERKGPEYAEILFLPPGSHYPCLHNKISRKAAFFLLAWTCGTIEYQSAHLCGYWSFNFCFGINNSEWLKIRYLSILNVEDSTYIDRSFITLLILQAMWSHLYLDLYLVLQLRKTWMISSYIGPTCASQAAAIFPEECVRMSHIWHDSKAKLREQHLKCFRYSDTAIGDLVGFKALQCPCASPLPI